MSELIPQGIHIFHANKVNAGEQLIGDSQLLGKVVDGVPIGRFIAEHQLEQLAAAPLSAQQRGLDLLRHGDLTEDILQRSFNQMMQGGEHTHQIGL